ncbi:MAG: hypothetical protein EHM58_19945 [Ignavibacteriae bacterium]|nr:MAG: hypothetical protein EHM58_19945 [Ignavibacteriota bacterium]
MKISYNKLISLGALVALIGFIMSGPVAFIIVSFVKPQPLWISPAVFVQNYSTIQDLPFYFGFLLIGGMLMLSAGHYLNFKEEDDRKKFHLLVSFGWTIAFFTLIAFNYICQTTFVHNLALNYKPEYDSAISTFSMSNPMSFCWANEMWGYAFLGIANMLMSEYYSGKNNLIKWLLVTNGIVSIGSAVWTIIDVSWVMTTGGLICYFIWNVLMIVLITLIYLYSRKQLQQE